MATPQLLLFQPPAHPLQSAPRRGGRVMPTRPREREHGLGQFTSRQCRHPLPELIDYRAVNDLTQIAAQKPERLL